MPKAATLEEVFHPRGVAVVGASPSVWFSYQVVQALKDAGFPAIYPVNPRYEETLGLKCYANLRQIPGPVDHVVVSIPAEAVLALLDDCAAKGVRSVHFFTAGFSETGYRERADLERAMLEKARAAGIRIIGPNCVGIYCPGARVSNTMGAPLDAGPVAFFSQSGGHAQNFPLDGMWRGLRFSKVVSYGNAVDVDEVELLDYFARDPETEIIAGYIEGVRDGQRFFRALKEACLVKPVAIYKAGLTEAGERAARSHTASLSGSMRVFEGLCRQAGAMLVEDIEELIDVLVALRFATPRPPNPGVAVLGTGGGPSVLASDEVGRMGLEVPPLAPEVQAQLREFLPLAGGMFSNPLDSTAFASDPAALGAAAGVMNSAANIGMVMFHMGFHPATRWGQGRLSLPTLQATLEGMQKKMLASAIKPLLVVLNHPKNVQGMEEFLQVQEMFVRARLPVFYSLGRAARAMAQVIAWQHQRR